MKIFRARNITSTAPAASLFHRAIADIVEQQDHGTEALCIAAEALHSTVDSGRFIQEYKELEISQHHINDAYPCAVALSVPQLNRYCDVLPYDHTRVVLKSCHSNDGDVPSTSMSYINASMIRNTNSPAGAVSVVDRADAQAPPPPLRWQYIAAQGPLSNTIGAFWNMVVQEKAETIVMLTGFIENQRKKCEIYFPENQDTSMQFDHGMVVVRNTKTDKAIPGIVCRTLEVVVSRKQDDGAIMLLHTHVVHHYHFALWPDHGVPSSPESFLILCLLMRKRSMARERELTSAPLPPDTPIVVHCSAGIGRSGVFCTVDIAIQQLLFALSCIPSIINTTPSILTDAARACIQEALDVKRIVYILRQQRCGMVQTQQQYEFCYKALLLAVETAIMHVKKKATMVS